MADLIRWFHDLEPVERTAAMAVIDDEKFVTFYMNILRDEHHQSKSGASHALFMIDYLEILRRRWRPGLPRPSSVRLNKQSSSSLVFVA